jgi:hypothetical protein
MGAFIKTNAASLLPLMIPPRRGDVTHDGEGYPILDYRNRTMLEAVRINKDTFQFSAVA